MKRRNFTALSAMAIPATFFTGLSPYQNGYAKWRLSQMESPIIGHLQGFQKELKESLVHCQNSKILAEKMVTPSKINHLKYQNEENYSVSFVNLPGNTITLKRVKGIGKTIIT